MRRLIQVAAPPTLPIAAVVHPKPATPVHVLPTSSETWDPPHISVDDVKQLDWNYSHVPKLDTDDMHPNEALHVLLDPFYDVTSGRLRRMFKLFHGHGKEVGVTYDEFEKGLFALGITPPKEMNFHEFVQKVDTDGDGFISLHEFVQVVQLIKQAHLFKPISDEQFGKSTYYLLRVVDYAPGHLRVAAPVRNLQGFMFSSKPRWAAVRWVHLAGFTKPDDLNLRRLAIKFQLHPLAVEDCVNVDGKIRCKYEHFEDHAFLVLPVIRPLDGGKRAHMEACIRDRRQTINIKDKFLRQASIGEIYDPDFRMSSSPKRKKWQKGDMTRRRQELKSKLNALHVLMRQPQQLCLFISRDKGYVISVQEEVDDTNAVLPLWKLVYEHHLTKSYSKVRNHKASFLVVSIINATVDEMMPLVAVFEATLKMLGKLLRLDGIQFNSKRFARVKKHLIAIDKVVRLMLDLVQDQLLDEDEFNHGEVKNYLRGVKDHLKQMASDLKDHQQTLASLVEEEKQIHAQHQANIMYIMSVAAACFLPGTFMTGVYGMNFDHMPELHHEYGYYLWWMALAAVVGSLLVFLKFYKHWI